MEEMITSKSETISVSEIRRLKEIANTMDKVLTQDEFVIIMGAYGNAIERMLTENGME